MAYGELHGMTSHDPGRWNSWSQYAEPNISKMAGNKDSVAKDHE